MTCEFELGLLAVCMNVCIHMHRVTEVLQSPIVIILLSTCLYLSNPDQLFMRSSARDKFCQSNVYNGHNWPGYIFLKAMYSVRSSRGSLGDLPNLLYSTEK